MVVSDVAVTDGRNARSSPGRIALGRSHPGTGAHGVLLGAARGLRLSAPAGRAQPITSLRNSDDAEIGRSEISRVPVLDRSLAILDGGVLLTDSRRCR